MIGETQLAQWDALPALIENGTWMVCDDPLCEAAINELVKALPELISEVRRLRALVEAQRQEAHL